MIEMSGITKFTKRHLQSQTWSAKYVLYLDSVIMKHAYNGVYDFVSDYVLLPAGAPFTNMDWLRPKQN